MHIKYFISVTYFSEMAAFLLSDIFVNYIISNVQKKAKFCTPLYLSTVHRIS